MAPEPSSDIKFDVGHVLFIDIVGYSRLLIHEQTERLQKLKEIARGTEQFRLAEAEGKLLRLPTGDGGALVFRTSPEAPVLCAVEIGRALKNHPELRVRMGVHSGPVNEITDLNEQANIAGAGINIAQRVMDCGDAGHILVSKRVAEDLEHYARWRPHLHDLRECEVKHGTRVHLFNLYGDEFGNAALPEKLKRKRRWGTGMPGKAKAFLGIPLAACALIAAAAFITSRLSRTAQSGKPQQPSQSSEKSIAVLPFDSLSQDPENAYFAEGIQEEILTRLAKVADLKVISRTSTQRFKSSPNDLREIAKQLGVAHILEGSVQKSADQVRVNVQLINALTDVHLWADTYDRKWTDIFQVESDVATRVAESLAATLTRPEQNALSSRPTENLQAHELYLKGRYYWNRRGEEGLRKAVQYFEQAINLDPNYALAYVGLADAYALLGFHGYGALPPMEAYPRAKAAAEKALAIAPTLGEAHASIANVKENYDWDVSGAGQEYKSAIALNPNWATAHQWYGLNLSTAGKHEEARAQMKRAKELDPLSLIINVNVAWAAYFARQYDEALEQCRKTIELEPNFAVSHWMMGQVYREKRMYDEAIVEFQKALDPSPSDLVLVAVLGHAYAVAGKRAEAEKTIADLTKLSTYRYLPAYFIALIYVGLGDKDRAMEWLEKSFAERSSGMVYLNVEPMFDPIRSDPRFQDLLARVALKRN